MTQADTTLGPVNGFQLELYFDANYRCNVDENGFPIGQPIVYGYSSPLPPNTGPGTLQWNSSLVFTGGVNKITPLPEDVANQFCFRSGSGTFAYQTWDDINDDSYDTPVPCGSIEIIDAY